MKYPKLFIAPSKLLLVASLLVLLTSCGGSLSDEQRKKMKEEMELHKIKRVTDVEITEAALARGRTIMKVLEKSNYNPATIDSIASATKTKIRWVVPGKSNATEVEQQLIEAYIAGAASGSIEDNLQKIRGSEEGKPDSLLYTKPVVKNLPDGSVQVEGTWNIMLPQKDVILGIK